MTLRVKFPNKFFVICSNVLGGCAGSTGPTEKNPLTNKNYGGDFPSITVHDMVKAQAYLIDALEIEKLFTVIGGSLGAMQTLQWSIDYPDRIRSIIHIAGALKHSAQNIAFHEVGRQAIMNDPAWNKGDYTDQNNIPERGLSVARMIAHITYLSEDASTENLVVNYNQEILFLLDLTLTFKLRVTCVIKVNLLWSDSMQIRIYF